MGVHLIKLPDVGEGVAEAEVVEWLVKDGQNVTEDQVLASVMTDKATVEIPSPVEGKIIWLGASIGEIVAVGSPLIRIEIDGEGNDDGKAIGDTPAPASTLSPAEAMEPLPTSFSAAQPIASKTATKAPAENSRESNGNGHDVSASLQVSQTLPFPTASGAPRPEGEAPLASPAVRRRALDAGVDLRRVTGSGPAGRIVHEDLDRFFERGSATSVSRGTVRQPRTGVEEIPVIGLRRKIAEKMATSKSRIPHITYVDEIDVTSLEDLRQDLNRSKRDDQTKLTLLPFLMQAMVRAIDEQPLLNAHFDDEAGVIKRHAGMHMGVAAQTDAGLVVPVIKHVEALGLWQCASEVARLANAAKDGKASRDELTGSTITITSLGALGGVVTTPVINYPEVAIIGVNKMQVLPRWDGNQFVPRKVMNLSSSFDHRVIDGWNAAVFVQRIKSLLESPATIFIEE